MQENIKEAIELYLEVRQEDGDRAFCLGFFGLLQASIGCSYSLPTKEIDIKNQGLDVAALRAATSNPSLGREYLLIH